MNEVLYLTTLRCPEGHDRTFAHKGPWVPPDQEAPWPDAAFCPLCRTPYPSDLGVAVTETHEAYVVGNPEVDPDMRGVTLAETPEGFEPEADHA